MSHILCSLAARRAHDIKIAYLSLQTLWRTEKRCAQRKKILWTRKKKEEKERKEQACFRGSLDFVVITCASPEDRLVILKHITYQIANRFIGHCIHASSPTSSAESNFVWKLCSVVSCSHARFSFEIQSRFACITAIYCKAWVLKPHTDIQWSRTI